ncbi:hypothetical protein NAS141_15063 [Sulfitobacter sp. NAS-14.1]|nr:hypothetical protein NAS141_15063 [Sulfitobacter sp. NAS-14.1]
MIRDKLANLSGMLHKIGKNEGGEHHD